MEGRKSPTFSSHGGGIGVQYVYRVEGGKHTTPLALNWAGGLTNPKREAVGSYASI